MNSHAYYYIIKFCQVACLIKNYWCSRSSSTISHMHPLVVLELINLLKTTCIQLSAPLAMTSIVVIIFNDMPIMPTKSYIIYSYMCTLTHLFLSITFPATTRSTCTLKPPIMGPPRYIGRVQECITDLSTRDTAWGPKYSSSFNIIHL